MCSAGGRQGQAVVGGWGEVETGQITWALTGKAPLDGNMAPRGDEVREAGGGTPGEQPGPLQQWSHPGQELRPPQGRAPRTLTLAQLLGLLGSLFFLGQALTAMLVYVWSRRSPQVRVNFFGLLTFQAPFLPWALMGFSLLLGNSILVDLLGEPACAPLLPEQAVW